MFPSRIRKLLRDHARTFALTLRLLPCELREPLSLAYLLARASDTVADAARIPHERRLAILEELALTIDEGSPSLWHPEIGSDELSVSERELIAALPDLIGQMELQSARAELLPLWRTIVEGQIFDLQRFGHGASSLSREELDRYCWLVAGSVGETWAWMVARRDSRVGSKELGEMSALAISYGKGLQLLNILRDRAEDREMGRVYIEEHQVPELMGQAVAWLDEGCRYCRRLRPGLIRYATEIPSRLALKTIQRMRKSPDGERVKISRYEVAMVFVKTLPSLVLP